MDFSDRHSDADIRIRLLEYIAKTYSNVAHFAALEARYSVGDRRADVLVVSDYIHAYEIKSDIDRLDRLPGQLRDYRCTFDFLTVVTTETHLNKVKNLLRKNDGLIVISQQRFKVLRGPKQNRRITKENMISMCSKTTLADILGVSRSTQSLETIRAMAAKRLGLAEIRHAVLTELKRRFQRKYDNFLQEVCIPYREYDLALLQHNTRLATANLLT